MKSLTDIWGLILWRVITYTYAYSARTHTHNQEHIRTARGRSYSHRFTINERSSTVRSPHLGTVPQMVGSIARRLVYSVTYWHYTTPQCQKSAFSTGVHSTELCRPDRCTCSRHGELCSTIALLCYASNAAKTPLLCQRLCSTMWHMRLHNECLAKCQVIEKMASASSPLSSSNILDLFKPPEKSYLAQNRQTENVCWK